ncbi:MAG: hypothetical protein Q9174_001247 [Haloplaca sp. 1 TL-2023]
MEGALGGDFDLDVKAIIYEKAWLVIERPTIGELSRDAHEMPSQLNHREAEMVIRYCKGQGSHGQFQEALFRYINRRKPFTHEWTQGDFHHFVLHLEKEANERIGTPPKTITDDEYTMRLLVTFVQLRDLTKADKGSASNLDKLLFQGTFFGSEQSIYDAFREAAEKLASEHIALTELCHGAEDRRPLEILTDSLDEDEHTEQDIELS